MKLLVYVVYVTRVYVYPDRIELTKSFLSSLSATELRSFLGIAGNYRRFTKVFSRLSVPLNASKTLNRNKCIWTEDHNVAFCDFEEEAYVAPLLLYPIFHILYIVETNAP